MPDFPLVSLLDSRWLLASQTGDIHWIWRWPLGQQIVLWLVAAMIISALWSYGWRGGHLGKPTRILLLTLRIIVAGVLGWMLAGPMAPAPTPASPSPSRLIVLADTSASMRQRDSQDESQPTRWQQVATRWLEPQQLARFGDRAMMQVYHFGQSIHSAPGQPWLLPGEAGQMETRLFSALQKAAGAGMPATPNAGGYEVGVSSDALVDQLPTRGGIVLLLSDGHDTQRSADPAVLSRLARDGWEIHAVTVGKADARPDVSVLAWAQSDFVLQGQRTTIQAAISHTGYDDASQTVRLLHQGREIDRKTITLPRMRKAGAGASEPQQAMVTFDVSPVTSHERALSVEGYQVVVDAQPGEARLENNERWLFIQVSRQQLRIALFEGQPYWDTRFLAQLLSRDPQVDLTALYGMGAGRHIVTRHEKGPAGRGASAALSLPVTAAQLSQFDIVILGRGCEQFFPGDQAKLLVDYVRNDSGVLLLARGRAFDISTPAGFEAQQIIASIEPITWGNQMVESLSLELAPQGRRSPLLEFSLPEDTPTILTRLPSMLAATRIEREKAASVVLLTQNPQAPGNATSAEAMAALVHQIVGSGQVLAMLSEGMWQWAFLPQRLEQYDMVYEQFWARMIRWLAAGGQFLPGQSVSLSLSRLSVEPGEPVTITAMARFVQGGLTSPRVTITAPDDTAQTIELALTSSQSQRWTGRFIPQQAGVYEIELLTPGLEPPSQTTRLAVYENAIEMQDTTPRHQLLQAAASATGGQVYAIDEVARFEAYLDQLRVSQQIQTSWTDAFDQAWMLALLVAALAGEWFIRRRHGLI